jgi:hypothetical protein
MTSEESESLIDAFKDLYATQPKLALAIFKTGLMQTGLNQNPISLFSILPNEIYEKLLDNTLLSYRQNTVNFVDDFYQMFYANNWNFFKKNEKRGVSIKTRLGLTDYLNQHFLKEYYLTMPDNSILSDNGNQTTVEQEDELEDTIENIPNSLWAVNKNLILKNYPEVTEEEFNKLNKDEQDKLIKCLKQ